MSTTFRGRVQGVGFRATTARVAEGHAVRGFVRNEPDGSVLCVAEGERDEVHAFLAAVRSIMAPCIETVDSSERPATGDFQGFKVRR